MLLRAVLMGQARIYWDMEHYSKVQAILQQSIDFCSEHEAWKLNSAHTFFMQGGKHMHLVISALLSLPAWNLWQGSQRLLCSVTSVGPFSMNLDVCTKVAHALQMRSKMTVSQAMPILACWLDAA